jgi:hypothetical protein
MSAKEQSHKEGQMGRPAAIVSVVLLALAVTTVFAGSSIAQTETCAAYPAEFKWEYDQADTTRFGVLSAKTCWGADDQKLFTRHAEYRHNGGYTVWVSRHRRAECEVFNWNDGENQCPGGP